MSTAKYMTNAIWPKLVLFSTEHCTLCEQALELLISMPELRGLSLEVLDVAADDVLLGRYGDRLPVVQICGAELDWPFDREQISAVLGKIEND